MSEAIIKNPTELADYIETHIIKEGFAEDGYPIHNDEYHKDEWELIIKALREMKS